VQPDPPSPIGPEQAALIAGRVSIMVGSRDAALRPHLLRAVGCRLSDDRRQVTLLVPQGSNGEVLDDLRDNGRIAVVFSEPSTHRTVQVKGRDARVHPCGPDDATLADGYRERFTAELGGIGHRADVAHAILSRGGAMMAVTFTITEAFEQTPGASAGQPLAR